MCGAREGSQNPRSLTRDPRSRCAGLISGGGQPRLENEPECVEVLKIYRSTHQNGYDLELIIIMKGRITYLKLCIIGVWSSCYDRQAAYGIRGKIDSLIVVEIFEARGTLRPILLRLRHFQRALPSLRKPFLILTGLNLAVDPSDTC